MKKRILAISDIHGCYDELCALLNKVEYNQEKDQLILLGDYVDRGQKSKSVLDLVIDLVDNGAIALRGNHDQMFLDWMLSNNVEAKQLYFLNGGLQTVESYVGYDWNNGEYWSDDAIYSAKKFIYEHHRKHITFLHHLPYYHKIDNHVFVHAGIDPFYSDWKNSDYDDLIWIREKFLDNRHSHEETFIHGHTPCINLHDSHDVYFGDKKIGIDGACAYDGQLNCLEIIDSTYETHFINRNKTTVIS